MGAGCWLCDAMGMAAVMEAAEGMGLEPSAEGGRDRLRRQGQPELLCGLLVAGTAEAGNLLCGKGPSTAGVALLRLRAAASLSMVGEGGSGSSEGECRARLGFGSRTASGGIMSAAGMGTAVSDENAVGAIDADIASAATRQGIESGC